MINKFRGEYRFLSNFWPYSTGKFATLVGDPAPIVMAGMTFPTVEHMYQAAKTKDLKKRREIIEAATPGLAKYLGRSVQLRPGWEKMKVGVMRLFVRAKFDQNPALATLLLATGEEELLEGNWWNDRFWGVDLKETPPVGENHLGQILMQVRQELIQARGKNEN